jgi:hypothetical protein
VAAIMGYHGERSRVQILLPQSRTEAKAEDKIDTRNYCTGNRAQENKILLTKIQANRRHEVPCNEGQQTTDHIIYDCNIVENQISYLMKQVMLSGGTWPPAKEEMISKYLKVFTRFVKLIDFQKLN